jgi:protein SCO1/2
MTAPVHELDRRTVLRTLGAAASVGVAGCLTGDDGGGRPADVALEPPENYDRIKDVDLPYPVYGDEVPEATLPCVVHDGPVSTREFVGDRHSVLTFVYTRCQGVCLTLGSHLVQVQAWAADAGHTDEVALLATNFDPGHDSPTEFREWGRERGLDYDLGNAYLLRPETPERARTVVEERFGEAYESREQEGMPFIHTGLILLVNDRGVVERAYAGDPPHPSAVIDDVETLVEG